MKKTFTNSKKFFAVLLTLVMVFSLLPMTAIAEDGEEPATSASQIVRPGGAKYFDDVGSNACEDDFVVMTSKTIKATDEENVFEITLEVKTTEDIDNISISPDTAVVLTIDISGSMAYNASGSTTNVVADRRMNIAKAAAKEFIDNYAASANGAIRYLSIVVFGLNAMVIQDWIDVSVIANRDTAKGQIDKIRDSTSASAGNYPLENGTFMQGGLQLSRNLYAKAGMGASVDNRFVVMITDGNPNCYIPTLPSNTSTATLTQTSGASENTSGWGAARPYAGVVANEIRSGTDDTASAKMYTIAYNTANTSIGPDTANGTYSSYTGSAGNWLRDRIAYNSSYALTATTDLNAIFAAINSSIARWAEAWTVTDPMGPYIKYVSPAADSATSNPKLVTEDGVETLKWDLKEDGSVTYDDPVYTYLYTYTVKLDTIAAALAGYNPAFDDENGTPTNGTTSLTYVMQESEDGEVSQLGDPITVNFKVPRVFGFMDRLKFTKVSSNGETLSGCTFKIESADGLYVDTATSNRNGKVVFTGIPSGHSYTVTEVYNPRPALYSKGAPFAVTVAYGEAYYDLENNEFVNSAKDVNIPLHKYFASLDGAFLVYETEDETDLKEVLVFICPLDEHVHGDDCYNLVCGLTEDDYDDAFEGVLHVHSFEAGCYELDEDNNPVLDEDNNPVLICDTEYDDPPRDAELHVHSDACYELICDIAEHKHNTADCYLPMLAETYTFKFELSIGRGEGRVVIDTLYLTLTKDDILALIELGGFPTDGFSSDKEGLVPRENKFVIPAEMINQGPFRVTESIEDGAIGWKLARSQRISLDRVTKKIHPIRMRNNYGDLIAPYFTIEKNLNVDIDETFSFILTDVDSDFSRTYQITGSDSLPVLLSEYANATATLRLEEVDAGKFGMQYDPTVYIIEIKDGEVVRIYKDGDEGYVDYEDIIPAEFNNYYYPPQYDEFSISKTIVGEGTGYFTFSYVIEGYTWDGIPVDEGEEPGNKVPVYETYSANITNSGSVTIKLEEFAEPALPNFTGTITVREIAGGGNPGVNNWNWDYDTTVYVLEFADGRFSGMVTDDTSYADVDAMVGFTNTFTDETPPPTPPPPTPPPDDPPYIPPTTPEPPPVVESITDEAPPLVIPEPEVPLADLPPERVDDVVIEEPDVPLANLPQTGLSTQGMPFAAFGFGLAALGAGIILKGKKKEDLPN